MTGPTGKIIYVCGGRNFVSINPGRKIHEVVKCWRELGWEVQHVCGGDVGSGLTTRQASGFGAASPGNTRLGNWLAPVKHSLSEHRDIRHDNLVFELLQKETTGHSKPLLIWERSSRLHSAGLRYAREIGVPFVLEWKDHLVDYRYSLFRRRALSLENRKNRSADRVVVESNVLKLQLIQDGIDPALIYVAHNAIDPDEFKPDREARIRIRTELNVADDCILAGYLGSYAFYHNTELLVSAAAQVRNSNLKFIMIGNGLEYEKCRQLARKARVLDRNLVMLPGIPMNEVPAVLCALDIAILPGSTDIICPVKIQEYMSSATPTIAPDFACNREVIPDQRFGLLFEPDNVESLAEVIDSVAADAGVRQTMGTAAREHVVGNFTWRATWGKALQDIVRDSRMAEIPIS